VTMERQRILMWFASQQRVVLQSYAIKRRARRIITRQSCERIDHFMIAGITTVIGFYTDNGDYHLSWDTERLLGPLQHRAMLPPKFYAIGNAQRHDKDRAIFFPGFGSFSRT